MVRCIDNKRTNFKIAIYKINPISQTLTHTLAHKLSVRTPLLPRSPGRCPQAKSLSPYRGMVACPAAPPFVRYGTIFSNKVRPDREREQRCQIIIMSTERNRLISLVQQKQVIWRTGLRMLVRKKISNQKKTSPIPAHRQLCAVGLVFLVVLDQN